MAIWLTCSILCIAARVRAQTGQEPAVQVEQYHGMRRVDEVPNKPTTKPQVQNAADAAVSSETKTAPVSEPPPGVAPPAHRAAKGVVPLAHLPGNVDEPVKQSDMDRRPVAGLPTLPLAGPGDPHAIASVPTACPPMPSGTSEAVNSQKSETASPRLAHFFGCVDELIEQSDMDHRPVAGLPTLALCGSGDSHSIASLPAAGPPVPSGTSEAVKSQKTETASPQKHADTEQSNTPIAPVPHVARESLEETWIQAGPTLAGTVLTPLAVLIGVWFLLRSLKGSAGPIIRIENVGGAPQSISLADLAGLLQASVSKPAPPQPASVSKPAPSQPAPAWAFPEQASGKTTAQPFKLGPTFEEEMLLQKEQARQQEEGLLQQLFEDNLKLQKQLTQAEPVPV
jgi:hypothetical protein